MDVRRNIMKDRNCESIDSTLKVNYIVDFGKNSTQRNVRLNPVLFKNSKVNTQNIKFKINDLRKEHYFSYSNEIWIFLDSIIFVKLTEIIIIIFSWIISNQ